MSVMSGVMHDRLILTHIWHLLTDVSGRLVGITPEDHTGQCCGALLGDFPVLPKHNFSWSSHENQEVPSLIL